MQVNRSPLPSQDLNATEDYFFLTPDIPFLNVLHGKPLLLAFAYKSCFTNFTWRSVLVLGHCLIKTILRTGNNIRYIIKTFRN
jgi:hypothetical protein